jgi:hypothetical protein
MNLELRRLEYSASLLKIAKKDATQNVRPNYRHFTCCGPGHERETSTVSWLSVNTTVKARGPL